MNYLLRTQYGYIPDVGDPETLLEAYRVRGVKLLRKCAHDALEDERCWHCDMVRIEICRVLCYTTDVLWVVEVTYPDDTWTQRSSWLCESQVVVGVANGRVLESREFRSPEAARISTAIQPYLAQLRRRLK